MPVGPCCELILIIIALCCPPLAVVLYKFFARLNLCDQTTGLNLALYIGAAVCSSFAGSLRASAGSFDLLSGLLGTVGGLLMFCALLHAIMTVCSCNDQSSSQNMRELGKSRKRGAGEGEQGGEKEIPAHLNVQSSYMICDCRGQKSKNGLFRVRVPRGLARRRKTAQAGEADESNLSSDESFEVGKEHMRRAMMPYVGKPVRKSSFENKSTTDEDSDSEADGRKYRGSRGASRSRQDSASSV